MINTIRYMGSKRKLVKELNDVFSLSNKKQMIDVFSGSGVISLNSPFKKIISNDIQKYSSVIVAGATKIFDRKLKEHILEKYKKWDKVGFIEKNYTNIFFSKKQASFLDSLKDYAFSGQKNRNTLLYIGIKMMFLLQNSPGHFAAMLKKSDRSYKLLNQDPEKVLDIVFEKWEYIDKKIKTSNKISDEILCEKKSLYYMDPPYTSEQYSRFYHLLETFVIKEVVELNDNKVKYAMNRFKSKFSNKKLALKEFEKHINKIYSLKSDIVISYSTNGVVSEKDIFKLLKRKFNNSAIKYISYKHSSLGGKPKETKEVIMWGMHE